MCYKILSTLINILSFKFIIDLKLKTYYFIEITIFILSICIVITLIEYNICIKYFLSIGFLLMALVNISRLIKHPEEITSLFFGATYHCISIIVPLLVFLGSLFSDC
jgi:hypothetical protein